MIITEIRLFLEEEKKWILIGTTKQLMYNV